MTVFGSLGRGRGFGDRFWGRESWMGLAGYFRGFFCSQGFGEIGVVLWCSKP